MTWRAIQCAMNRTGARAIGVAATGVLGLIVVGTAAACRTNTEARTLGATDTAAGPAGVPMLVSCRTGEQVLLRQAVVNGETVSQVECVSAASPSPPVAQPDLYTGAAGASSPQPLAYQQADVPPQPQVYGAGAPTGAQPAVYQPAAAVPETRVVREPEVRRSKRSWQKSAVVIGSSAAIGAGVGGATGGKKGALIGAAVGGGGAAIWDAVTRSR
ncbi:MAG: hypothetical protein GEV06_23680 [Luteitalea sp.]|nr:hypothetical protein [Luteitalea sp.]